MQKLIYTVDMKGVVNRSDITYKLRHALNIFNGETDAEYKKRIESNTFCSWDALLDDFRYIPLKNNNPDLEEVHVIIKNIDDVDKNVSKLEKENLVDILTELSDPEQRIDGIKFTYSIS